MNSIEEVSISDLSFDPSNVRRHSNRNIDAIKDSLNAFGQQRPILVDRRGIVLAGNGTMAAAKALGWKTIRVLRTSLEGAEAIAYAIADNRTAELAEWDQEGLMRQLNAIQIESEDLFKASGFEMSDLDVLLDSLEESSIELESSAQEIDVDSFDLEHKCPRCGFEFEKPIVSQSPSYAET